MITYKTKHLYEILIPGEYGPPISKTEAAQKLKRWGFVRLPLVKDYEDFEGWERDGVAWLDNYQKLENLDAWLMWYEGIAILRTWPLVVKAALPIALFHRT
jgi:hypothetical protein